MASEKCPYLLKEITFTIQFQSTFTVYFHISFDYYTPMTVWIKNPPSVQEMQETWAPFLAQEDSPGGGNGNPIQYSCLEKLMNRGTWWARVHGFAKEQDMTE